MPSRSPESLERERIRRNAKKRAMRAAAKAAVRATMPKSDWPAHKISARRMMGRLPAGTTKADLRDMLAQAMANTALL